MDQKKPKFNDGGYGWIVVLSAFTVTFLIDGIFFTFGILMIALIEEFDKPVASLAALAGIFLGFDAIASPFAGSLSDAFGRRHVTVVGAVLFSSGLFISTFAPNIALLYFSYGVLGGTGYGLMCTPPFAAVMEHFDERRAFAGGISLCGAGVGIFVMSLVTNRLLDAFGLRGTFLLLSGIMLNGIPCGLALLKPQGRPDIEDNDNHTGITETRSSLSLKKEVKRTFFEILVTDNVAIFRDFQCLCFLLSTVCYGLAFFVPFSFLPEQAVALGFGKDKAAWLTSAMGIANTLGRLTVGWLGNRSFINLTILLKCILLLTAVLFPASLLLTAFETKLVFACVFGVLFGGYIVAVPVALADMVPVDKVGKTTGLFISMLAGANLIGAPIVGWTIDVTGDYNVCYILAGGECLLALVILILPQLRRFRIKKEAKSQTTHL